MKVYNIYVMSAIIKQPDYIILKSTEEPNMINNEDKLELVNIQISYQHILGRTDLSQKYWLSVWMIILISMSAGARLSMSAGAG